VSTAEALRSARSFFLAGTMQGSRRGSEMVDQGYREELREIIGRHVPDAEIRDPAELMAGWLGAEAEQIRTAHAALATVAVVRHDRLAPPLVRLTDVFDRLVHLSGDSDVCVAWLPDHEPSMGTAVEMWAAHAGGRLVVAVTRMRQNLAVLACSDLVVPTLTDLEVLLADAVSGGVHVPA
jgi:hypothetical protein